jgi:hypothetical protein
MFIECYNKGLALEPTNFSAWFYKAQAEDQLNMMRDCIHSLEQFLSYAPSQFQDQIIFAKQRINTLRNYHKS